MEIRSVIKGYNKVLLGIDWLNQSNTMNVFSKKFIGEEREWDSEMQDLFNGYGEIGGESTPYSKSADFLKLKTPDTVKKVLDACLIIYNKPLSWLMTGKQKNPGGKRSKRGKRVEAEEEEIRPKGIIKDGLAQYLPMMTVQEVESMDDTDREEMLLSRSDWPEAFKYLNVTKCKRLALMGLEMSKPVSKLQSQWLNVHSGRPSSITDFNIGERETNEIFEKDLKEFVKYKEDWNQKWIKDLIQGKTGKDRDEQQKNIMTVDLEYSSDEGGVEESKHE